MSDFGSILSKESSASRSTRAGAWFSRRESKRACAEGEACARPVPNRLVKAALMVAVLLVVAAIGLDFFGSLFLNS